MARLTDFHRQQRSGDVLEELTRGVELFLPLSVRRGQSACALWTVRGYCVRHGVLRVLVLFRFDMVLF
jgi:hypothetical protein